MNNRERIKTGFRRMKENNVLFLIPVAFVLFIGILTYIGKDFLLGLEAPFSSKLFGNIFIAFMVEIGLLGALGMCVLVGLPLDYKKVQQGLSSICFTDKNGVAPLLLSKKKDKNGVTMEFFSASIPLSEYHKRSAEIETALNIKIISSEYIRDMRHVAIRAVSGTIAKDHKKTIYWKDDFISKKDFELVLGESCFGTESIDISVTPHILIGGGSGSGKSKLLKLILMQCIRKGALVYIADFKGGVDYPPIWHNNCMIITKAIQLDNTLGEILQLLEMRRNMLVNSETTNIQEYFEKTGEAVPRIIVACDEVAEVLDKTGLGKDERALVGQIESKLSTIARLGRAFGIHLVLATQRPDADILKGQIKSNIGYRVCGRADKVLSQIILDNSEAAEQIALENQGMFLTNTRVLFKAYYYEDDCLGGAVEVGTYRNQG